MEFQSSSGSVLNTGKKWFLKTVSLGKFKMPNYIFWSVLIVFVFGTYQVYSRYVLDYNQGLVAGISKKISPTPCISGKKCPVDTLTPTPLPTGAASLNIALSPLVVSGTYTKGTPNVNVVAFSLTAGTEDVHVNGLTLKGLAGASNGSLGSNYASIASMLVNFRLYDGVSGTPISAVVTSGNLPVTGSVSFGNMDWVIPTGTSKTLLLKVDLSNNTPDANDTFSFDLESAASITVSTSTPGEVVSVSGADLNGSSTANVAITVSNGGSLQVSQGPASPSKSGVYWGQTNAPFSQFRLIGTNEGFYVEKLTLATLDQTEKIGANANVASVYLTYRNEAGSTLTVNQPFSTSGASASFGWTAPAPGGTDTRPFVPQNSSLDISVAADMRMAATGATSGIKFSIDFSNTHNGSAANGFKAIGASSGQVINGSSPGITDVFGQNNQYVYRAFPKFDIVPLPSPYPLLGNPTVFKFTITAMGLSDSQVFFDNQALGSGSIRFEVLASGGSINIASPSLFTVYDDSGVTVDTMTGAGDFRPSPNASLTLDFGRTGVGQDVQITGGQSKTFRIQFDNPSVHYNQIGDYFQLVLRDNENGLINWVDNNTTGRASIAEVLRNLPMNGPVFTKQTASIWGKLFGFIGKLF